MPKAKTKTRKKIVQKQDIIQPELTTVVLLCDLPGYRMKSYGPTSLIKIKNKYLIDMQIDAIKKTFSNCEIIICVGFEGEKILKHIRSKYTDTNIRIVENQLFNSCNSCESVRISINNTINNKIIICDGSLLINKRTFSSLDTSKNCAIIEKDASENLEIGININQENKAQHFSFGAYRTWSEIICINGSDIVETLRRFLISHDNKKKFIFEAINELIKNKYEILCIENKYPIFKINNIKTYHNIRDNHEIFNL
jgi:hypothetical protein